MDSKFQIEDQELYEAKKAVSKKFGFYIHLIVFVCVNLFFHIVNWIDGAPYWAFFPLLFWGFGLGIHFLSVFDIFRNSNWKKKQILKQIEKQRKNNPQP